MMQSDRQETMQLFEDLIARLLIEKEQLRQEKGGIGRYVALCLTDVEKSQAVYSQHVYTNGERESFSG